MKKTWTLILLLFSGMSIAIETCDYVDESAQVVEENEYLTNYLDESRPINDEERWMIDLNMQLMKLDDIQVAVKALASVNEAYGFRIDPETQEPLLSLKDKLLVLKKVATAINADAETLLIAVNLCEQIKNSAKCDLDYLKDRLFEMDPDNIIIYLSDLSKAVKDDDAEMVKVIVKRISEAKFSHLPLGLSPNVIKAIDNYVDENPYQGVFDDDFIKETGRDITDFDLDLWNRQSIMMAYKVLTISNYPELNPLILACTDYLSKPDHCLNIANTLINNSNSMLMSMIGYNLQENVYQQIGDEKAFELSQTANAEHQKYLMCLMKNQMQVQSTDYLMNPDMLKMIIESDHELKTYEKISVYLFEKYHEAGVEDLTDPKSCGLRYIN